MVIMHFAMRVSRYPVGYRNLWKYAQKNAGLQGSTLFGHCMTEYCGMMESDLTSELESDSHKAESYSDGSDDSFTDSSQNSESSCYYTAKTPGHKYPL